MSSVKKKSSFKRQQRLHSESLRYHAVDIDGPAYIVAHFPDSGDTSEKIPLEPGLKLYQVFEEPLRARGLNVNDVEIFIERSSSAIPENADVRFLAGRNVIVRGTTTTDPPHVETAVELESSKRTNRKEDQADARILGAILGHIRLERPAPYRPMLSHGRSAAARDALLSAGDNFGQPLRWSAHYSVTLACR
ncbi:unnamed protein product [Heligmosomoides polygyrus]|uniref:Transposase n=1 Tax=Heligmosomoides polygyrus TaxID=6339 RepID=A0A3P8B6Q0_HELPZ|nr:unnamed protein product [Heligmosomoides polygyrus]